MIDIKTVHIECVQLDEFGDKSTLLKTSPQSMP